MMIHIKKRQWIFCCWIMMMGVWPLQAAYREGLYPMWGTTLGIGLLKQCDTFRLYQNAGKSAELEWPLKQMLVGTFSLDLEPTSWSRVSVFTTQKLNEGKGVLQQKEWQPAGSVAPTAGAQYPMHAKHMYSFGGQGSLVAFEYGPSTASVLVGYRYTHFSLVGDGGRLRNNTMANSVALNKVQSQYRTNTSNAYVGLRYDLSVERFNFGIEGVTSRWAAVDTKVLAVPTKIEARGRFRKVHSHGFNSCIGYSFFPAWRLQLAYQYEHIPNVRGSKVQMLEKGVLVETQAGAQKPFFTRSQNIWSLQLQGTF